MFGFKVFFKSIGIFKKLRIVYVFDLYILYYLSNSSCQSKMKLKNRDLKKKSPFRSCALYNTHTHVTAKVEVAVKKIKIFIILINFTTDKSSLSTIEMDLNRDINKKVQHRTNTFSFLNHT